MSPRNSKPVPDSGTTSNSGKRNRVRTEKPRTTALSRVRTEKPRTTALSRVRTEEPKPPRGSKPPKPAREKLPDGAPIVTPLRSIPIKRRNKK